jgi:SAM-dependent methyltransferase
MKNIESWEPTKFRKDKKGRFLGTHMHRAMGPYYEKSVKNFAHGELMDLGCGEVPLYFIYKDIVRSIFCVDWSNSGHNLRHIDMACDLNQKIPIDSSKFDTIICTDVLEHIAEPSLLMSEISRMLKPGGTLILGVPFYYCLHEVPHDYYRYTSFALERFCKENKLSIKLLEPYGGAPEIIADVIYKTYDFLNLPGRKGFLKFWNWFCRILLSRRISKKISKSSSKHFPLGYVLVANK